MKKLLFACVLGLLAPLAPAHAAADVRTEKVVLAASGSATLKGKIKGGQTARYLVRATQEGDFTVELKPSNASTYFNITQAGKDEALHIGSVSGNVFTGRLPAAGDYIVTVYLMRNAARRNASSSYTLRIAQQR